MTTQQQLPLISKTAALTEARRRNSMFRQGRQWVVSSWSESHRAAWHHNPTDYFRARGHLADCVARDAFELMGYDPMDAGLSDSGSASDRLDAMLRDIEVAS